MAKSSCIKLPITELAIAYKRLFSKCQDAIAHLFDSSCIDRWKFEKLFHRSRKQRSLRFGSAGHRHCSSRRRALALQVLCMRLPAACQARQCVWLELGFSTPKRTAAQQIATAQRRYRNRHVNLVKLDSVHRAYGGSDAQVILTCE